MSNKTLKYHQLRQHSAGKPVNGDKSYGALSELQTPQTTHIAETSRFSCDKCPNKYYRASHLKRYIDFEYIGARIRCNFCVLEFTCKGSFLKHLASQHTDINTNYSNIEKSDSSPISSQ